MNAKERVRTTLAHKEPDRVPMALSASPWVVEKLKARLHATTDKELLELLHIDLFDMRGIDLKGKVAPRYIGPTNVGISPDWSGDVLPLWGVKERIVETGQGKMYQQDEFPLTEAESLEEVAAYSWPDPDWFDYRDLDKQLERWSEFAIVASGCSVFQHPTFVRGMDKLFIDMIKNPQIADYLFTRFADFYYEYFARQFQVAGDLIDILRIADDLGGQNNLLISPQMIKRFFLPRLRRFAQLSKTYGIKLLLHTDGNIYPIIPQLIESGVEILDPLQPEATDMDPLRIKKEFGDQLTLMGAISVQHVLSTGSAKDVKEEVKRRIDQLAPGGGYILSPGHPVLQVDVPVENILAMYETGFLYGRY